VSDNMILVISAASLSSGVLVALWLALSAPAFRRSQVVGGITRLILHLGTAGALLVIVLTAAHRGGLSLFGFAPIIAGLFMAGLFMAGIVLAALAASPAVLSRPFGNQDGLRSLAFSQPTVQAARYLTAAYFLMVGLFKWITYAEYSFFQSSGYSKDFYIFICLFECICAVGLLLRATIVPAVLALAVEMGGAIYTHFHNYFTRGTPDPFGSSLDAFCMLILVAYIGVAALREREGGLRS
jgi:hypothetical protein